MTGITKVANNNFNKVKESNICHDPSPGMNNSITGRLDKNVSSSFAT